ncbi:MAG TPA: FHA domain-containing protein [Leptolinea sp.]
MAKPPESRDVPESPVFIAQSGVLSGQRWSIDRELTIGRDPSCSLVIPDRQVSRIHARITITPKGILLEDLGSKNGTFSNSELIIDPVILKDGDEIQVAMVQTFLYLSSDATMPLETTMRSSHEKLRRLRIDMRSRRIWIRGTEISPPLSVPQFRVIQILDQNPGEVVSRQDLISEVWGDEVAQGVSDQALDALIRRLRDRISQIDPSHEYLVTVRGYGFRINNPEE